MSKGTRVINTIPQAIYYACNEYAAGDGKVPAPKAGYLYIVTKEQEAQHPDRDDLIYKKLLKNLHTIYIGRIFA